MQRKFQAVHERAETTVLQRLAASAVRRALDAERSERAKLRRWLEEEEEMGAEDEDSDDAGELIVGGASASGTKGRGYRLVGRSLRLGVPRELARWHQCGALGQGSADLQAAVAAERRLRDAEKAQAAHEESQR